MADIFFSYKREDHDRIRPFYVALKDMGFEVAWDQKILAAAAWENWILSELVGSGIVLVFWSHGSIQSDYVKKEARLAKDGKKLLPVFIDALSAIERAGLMGFDGIQFADLSNWKGNTDDPAWQSLVAAIEDAITPDYVRRQLSQKDEEVRAAKLQRNALVDREAEFERQLRAEGQSRNEAAKRERQAVLDLADVKEQLDKIGLQAQEAAEKLKSEAQGREEAQQDAREKTAEASHAAELLADVQKQLAAATTELDEAKSKLANAPPALAPVPPPMPPTANQQQRRVIPLVLALACGLGIGAIAANALWGNSALSANNLQRQVTEAKDQIDDLKRELQSAHTAKDGAERRSTDLQKQVQSAQGARDAAEKRNADLQKQVQSAQAAKDAADKRVAELQTQLAAPKSSAGEEGDERYRATKALQLKLHALGYYSGAMDGIPGLKLETALKGAYSDGSSTILKFREHLKSSEPGRNDPGPLSGYGPSGFLRHLRPLAPDPFAQFLKGLADDKQLGLAAQRAPPDDININLADAEARWAGSFPFDSDAVSLRLLLKGTAFSKLIVLDNALNVKSIEVCKGPCESAQTHEKKTLDRTDVLFKNCGSKFCFSLDNFAPKKGEAFDGNLWMRLKQVPGLPKSYSLTTIYR